MATRSVRPVRLAPLGYLDLPGGGQVVVDGDLAFVGHIEPPNGTSIIDVADPRRPRVVARLSVPPHTHSHKVRARDGLMLVNQEGHPYLTVPPGLRGGLKIYDVREPASPREIAFHETGGTGAHRFDFDGRYVYLSTELDGFLGHILLILDLVEPTRPREVAKWWVPGQWIAGGEQPRWQGRDQRIHHALRFGDRLYVSCWQGGFAILDVADLARPRTLARFPSRFGYPTHTLLPIPSNDGREIVAVVDEGWNDAGDAVPAFLWTADVTDPGSVEYLGRYEVPPPRPGAPGFWGAHQPHEEIIDGLAFVAWFQNGLRVVDLADPARPAEAAAWLPQPRGTPPGILSNDVFLDRRNRIYLIDRDRGLDILEWSR